MHAVIDEASLIISIISYRLRVVVKSNPCMCLYTYNSLSVLSCLLLVRVPRGDKTLTLNWSQCVQNTVVTLFCPSDYLVYIVFLICLSILHFRVLQIFQTKELSANGVVLASFLQLLCLFFMCQNPCSPRSYNTYINLV